MDQLWMAIVQFLRVEVSTAVACYCGWVIQHGLPWYGRPTIIIFDPNAAYFGCKKASEPLHIQWNPLRDDIEVVNYHAFDRTGLTATASLFNQDGTLQWTRETKLDIKEDQTVACFPLEQPETLSDTYFIKLSLTDSDGKQLSDNFYWRGKEDGNYKSLLQLPKSVGMQKCYRKEDR